MSSNTIDISVTLPDKRRTLGKTQFYFMGTNFKIIPEGNALDTVVPFTTYCNPTKNLSNIGRGCTAWVLYNKNMDYLHCPNDLGWSKKNKC